MFTGERDCRRKTNYYTGNTGQRDCRRTFNWLQVNEIVDANLTGYRLMRL